MPLSPIVPIAEHLHTAYRPDCEYLEGAILERNVGAYSHSTVQTEAWALINARSAEWSVKARVELRVNVKPGRYRVPDVVIFDRARPREKILTHPPILCIEVLSPEDRVSEMEERIAGYARMGGGCVWIVDPLRSKAWVRTGRTTTEATDMLRVPGTPIEIPLAPLFAEL